MTVQIIAMTPDHIEAARQLWSESEGVEVAEGDSPEEIERFLARNPGLSTVAVDATGAVVAAVMGGHDARRGYIYHLAVANTRRGEGIARAVMRRTLQALREQGIVRALLLVAEDNAGGHAFWLREGWEDMPFAKPMGIDL